MTDTIALVFDIDDTLYRQIDLFQSACEEAMGGKKLPNPELFYQIFGKRSYEMFLESSAGRMELHQSRICRIMKTMEDLQIPFTEEMAEDFQRRYKEKQQNLKLSPALAEILERCKAAGIRMGVISNGPDQHQKEKCHIMGLEQWIPMEHVLVSEGVGCAKPESEIFRMAEQRLGITDETVYMIGDSFANDMAGAMNAGWKTIWVNYHGYQLPEGAKKPDYQVKTQEELRDVILGLGDLRPF